MVRPERRVVLAGESLVRVSTERPVTDSSNRRDPAERSGVSKAFEKEKGAKQRAATKSERNSLVKLSAERCSGEPRRSFHGEGNRQQRSSEPLLDLSGVEGDGTLSK